MGEIHPGYLIGLLILLILCSAFFASAETGMLGLDRYRLRHQAKQGNRAARRTSWLLLRTDRLLGTILIGNNFVNIVASALATLLALRLWGEAGVAVATVLLTLVLLVFGEITPKTYAALRPEKVALPASLPLYVLQKLFAPLLWLMNGFSNALLRLFGLDPRQGSRKPLNSDELRSVVGQMQGSVEIQTRGSQRIGENVEAVQSAVRGITEGLKQQGEASQGVALVVRRSMDYTRSHESTAAEISRAAETLARQAEALRESVRRFRI